MSDIAVVILNYNGKKFLNDFLPSVIQYSKEARVIVADNNSTDDSVAFLKDKFPEVECLVLDENTGFAGGYNNALKLVDAQYYVLLNSDIEVTEGWLTGPIEYLKSANDIAACQPKIRAYHAKEKFEHAGAAGGYIDKWGYPFCRGRMFNNVEVDEGQYDQIKEVFWATGACLFIKAELFHEYGGFDAKFFAHMEEIDLCWRLKNGGYRIGYVPTSTVFHVGGGTLNTENPKKTYLNFRNGLALLYKNLPKNKVFKTLFLRLLLDGIAGAMFLVNLKPRHTWAVLKAHFHFYGWFSYLKGARKIAQKHTVNFEHKEMLKRTIVFRFFLAGKKKFSDLAFSKEV